ncbi:MAG: 3-phosphoshikimate 1-carboxyvinyltransferase [Alphaproteobacteria bacterium]|jgi:3-phosphoshikimate 1-carboxyvinyltransferase|tara:strand:+ start:399 stop:1751 length:1353 start_codon:yes stop_codon:yes gene_type:complete
MTMEIKNKKSIKAFNTPGLKGKITIPGDKSISHRALILGSMCVGKTIIKGLLESEDIFSTINALIKFGVDIERKENGDFVVHGVGVGGHLQPDEPVYLGNSGTSARLLIGLVSSCDITVDFLGDESLSSRPMNRIIDPIIRIGAEVIKGDKNKLPFTVKGSSSPLPIKYEMKIPSAQIKSAIMISALNIRGETTIIEPVLTRDHTENLLNIFGANISITKNKLGHKSISIRGHKELKPTNIVVPGDPSSAAFIIVAALIVPGSSVVIKNVMINKTRSIFIDFLIEMGADIIFLSEYQNSGEKVVDLKVNYSQLYGIDIPSTAAPAMIDEYLIISIAAAYAKGKTLLKGLGELRVKESDRFSAIKNILQLAGVRFESFDDDIVIYGNSGSVKGGCLIDTNLDHRVAMASIVMGLGAEEPIEIDDGSSINTSFSEFFGIMKTLGGNIKNNEK